MKKLCATLSATLMASVPLWAQAPADKPAAKPPAQKSDKPAAPPAGGEMPAAKPGPEHEALKKMAGTWDATVEMLHPGATPEKGTETNKLLGDGLWVVSDFKSMMGQQPFEGHGVWGYDPAKKKYVGTWVDSMTSALTTSEGTYDPATKTETSWMDTVGHDGKPTKMKATTEWKDDDTRVFTMYMGEAPSMRITYKRRK
jgi:uncharacterized protein DUF1579